MAASEEDNNEIAIIAAVAATVIIIIVIVLVIYCRQRQRDKLKHLIKIQAREERPYTYFMAEDE